MKNVPFVHPLSPRAREKFLESYASVCSFLELLLVSILLKFIIIFTMIPLVF